MSVVLLASAHYLRPAPWDRNLVDGLVHYREEAAHYYRKRETLTINGSS